MVQLLIGHKGSGKTNKMIQIANESIKTCDGSIIFINKNHRLMYELSYRIRVICMEDFEHITNIDEYIGFIYGIISSDHDIETIFIDRLKAISEIYGVDFVVSVSAEKEEMIGVNFDGCEILN